MMMSSSKTRRPPLDEKVFRVRSLRSFVTRSTSSKMTSSPPCKRCRLTFVDSLYRHRDHSQFQQAVQLICSDIKPPAVLHGIGGPVLGKKSGRSLMTV